MLAALEPPCAAAAASDFYLKLLTSSKPAAPTKTPAVELADGHLARTAIPGAFLQGGLSDSACGIWAFYTASSLRASRNEFGMQAPTGYLRLAGSSATLVDPAERPKDLAAELVNDCLLMRTITHMFFQGDLISSAWADWNHCSTLPLRALQNGLGTQLPVEFFLHAQPDPPSHWAPSRKVRNRLVHSLHGNSQNTQDGMVDAAGSALDATSNPTVAPLRSGCAKATADGTWDEELWAPHTLSNISRGLNDDIPEALRLRTSRRLRYLCASVLTDPPGTPDTVEALENILAQLLRLSLVPNIATKWEAWASYTALHLAATGEECPMLAWLEDRDSPRTEACSAIPCFPAELESRVYAFLRVMWTFPLRTHRDNVVEPGRLMSLTVRPPGRTHRRIQVGATSRGADLLCHVGTLWAMDVKGGVVTHRGRPFSLPLRLLDTQVRRGSALALHLRPVGGHCPTDPVHLIPNHQEGLVTVTHVLRRARATAALRQDSIHASHTGLQDQENAQRNAGGQETMDGPALLHGLRGPTRGRPLPPTLSGDISSSIYSPAPLAVDSPPLPMGSFSPRTQGVGRGGAQPLRKRSAATSRAPAKTEAQTRIRLADPLGAFKEWAWNSMLLRDPNPGQGDCLFHAMAQALASFGNPTPQEHLRRNTADYMLRHPDEVLHAWDRKTPEVYPQGCTSFAAYLATIAQPGAWARDVELVALGKLHPSPPILVLIPGATQVAFGDRSLPLPRPQAQINLWLTGGTSSSFDLPSRNGSGLLSGRTPPSPIVTSPRILGDRRWDCPRRHLRPSPCLRHPPDATETRLLPPAPLLAPVRPQGSLAPTISIRERPRATFRKLRPQGGAWWTSSKRWKT